MAKLTSITSRSARDVRADWEYAVAHLKAAEEEYADISPQHTAAFAAAEAECPREDEFFSRYNLGWYEDKERGRERNFRSARMVIVNERCGKLGRSLTTEEAREATAEAERVVAEFDAWSKRRDETLEKHDCDTWETRFNAVHDKRWAAQQAVIGTEAPDLKAMHVKLELLASMMDGMEDQARVEAIRDDARRLVTA